MVVRGLEKVLGYVVVVLRIQFFPTFQVSFLAAMVPSSPLQLLHMEVETLQGLVVEMEREAQGEVVVVLDLVVTLLVSLYIFFLPSLLFFLFLGADLQPVHVVHLGDLLLDGLEVLHAVISA